MAESEKYDIHKYVFQNDLENLKRNADKENIKIKDKHGNTPLHLASMLGHTECLDILIKKGAQVKTKNADGWTALAEAVSYGSRKNVMKLYKSLKEQSRITMQERRPHLVKALEDIGNFRLELKWDFHSWVPIVSRLLPSDVCTISKKGSSVRLDTTLVDFQDMKWERGDISFIYIGKKKNSKKNFFVLDNKLKVYQKFRSDDGDIYEKYEDEVDILMSSDIISAQIPTKNISFVRMQTGFFVRQDKSQLIGNFQSDLYTIQGLVLEQKKRREHLSAEDLQKNKAIIESLSKGNIEANHELDRRTSLTAPVSDQVDKVTWEDYISANLGEAPCLGRPIVCKTYKKHFKATMAMSKDFPMSTNELLNILEVVAPLKHYKKLRDFFDTQLPPGFPVKIEIPVFPTVTAKVTFQDFEWCEDIEDSLFTIPNDYKEDGNRFPEFN